MSKDHSSLLTLTDADKAYFWSRVDCSGDGCWEWQHALGTRGYGKIMFRSQIFGCHRVAWILTNGLIPDGLFACHHCDNPKCCRPDHLFLGTIQDNNRDRDHKGHHSKGDTHWTRRCPERLLRGDETWARKNPGKVCRGEQVNTAKLTAEQVRAIRIARAAGVETKLLASIYQVDLSTIWFIVSRRTWKHIV